MCNVSVSASVCRHSGARASFLRAGPASGVRASFLRGTAVLVDCVRADVGAIIELEYKDRKAFSRVVDRIQESDADTRMSMQRLARELER